MTELNRTLIGDCRDSMRALIVEGVRVQACVTSPPYWRQRDYGHPEQIGLEKTPEEYIEKLVGVFGLVRQLLCDDGTLWINIGDKWASGGNGGGGSYMAERAAWADKQTVKGCRSPPTGYKDKDLIGVPWMLAFALRADGWYLRQCNIWAKPNCMPESCVDRSTASHEYVLQLSKSAHYFYDNETARTPPSPESETRLNRSDSESLMSGSARSGKGHSDSRRSEKQRGHGRRHNGFNDRWDAMSVAEQRTIGANLRSVWWIAPAASHDEHYAQMPELLAEICIVCGSRPGDIVFDPFMGSGTTGQVAQRLGRGWFGCELNPAYVKLERKRTAQQAMQL